MIAARSRGDAPTFPTILTIAHDKRGHNLTSYPYRTYAKAAYVCSTYNRFGKEHCSQHQIDESVLDSLIIDELRNTKALYQQNWDALEQLIAQWTPKAELTGAQIIKLEKKICCLEDETEVILMERIRDRANAERYDRMIQKREEEIAAAKSRSKNCKISPLSCEIGKRSSNGILA